MVKTTNETIFESFVHDREKEKEKYKERGRRSELKQYSTLILSTLLPPPPLSFSFSCTNRTVHSFSFSAMHNHQKLTSKKKFSFSGV
jgi:hypothetical protein